MLPLTSWVGLMSPGTWALGYGGTTVSVLPPQPPGPPPDPVFCQVLDPPAYNPDLLCLDEPSERTGS